MSRKAAFIEPDLALLLFINFPVSLLLIFIRLCQGKFQVPNVNLSLQIIIGDTLTSLGEQIWEPGLWYLDRRIVISTVGLGVLFPLCCLR